MNNSFYPLEKGKIKSTFRKGGAKQLIVDFGFDLL